MLTVEEAIQERRSVRSFLPDPVPRHMVYRVLEAARLAPSGSNRQPWRFIVVQEAKEKRRLRELCNDQTFIEEAPVVVVCCTDLGAFTKAERSKRYQEFADHGVLETLTGRFADPAYREELMSGPDPDLKTFLIAAVANAYIAIEHLVLMATALGLGTCWVGAMGRDEEMRELFGLLENIVTVALVAIGYPTRVPGPPRPRHTMEQIMLRPLPSLESPLEEALSLRAP